MPNKTTIRGMTAVLMPQSVHYNVLLQWEKNKCGMESGLKSGKRLCLKDCMKSAIFATAVVIRFTVNTIIAQIVVQRWIWRNQNENNLR